MKKIFFFLAMTAFCGQLQAQTGSCVTATQVGTNYADTTVTFVLTWKEWCSNTTTHLNRVWVFVDIQPVDEVTGEKGAWTPASFTGTPNVVNATSLTVADNTRGFYVTSNNNQSATITMQIHNAPAKFNWCAFATDYPPNVSAPINVPTNAGTIYTFKGSPPFVVNGVAQNANTYSGTLISLTDATGCPGRIGCDAATHTKIPCSLELTPAGGYCRNLAADDAIAVSTAGCDFEYRTRQWSAGCGTGWTWVSRSDIKCVITVVNNWLYTWVVTSTTGGTCCGYASGSSAVAGYLLWDNCNGCNCGDRCSYPECYQGYPFVALCNNAINQSYYKIGCRR